MASLVFPKNPSPIADAEAIRKATKGWGTDEKAIIAILGRRNSVQRKLIRKAYEDLYQEDLVKVLESELSGDFEVRAVYRWILDPEDRDAVLLNVAVKKQQPVDYRVVVELSCVASPDEFLAIKRAYHARYKHSLEEDVANHTTGDLRQLLVRLVSVYRYHSDEKNARLADKEADILHNAIKAKHFNHEEIIRIITTRSKSQIIATLNRYKDDHGHSVTKHLREDVSNPFLTAVRTAIKCIDDPKKYFEKTIRHAVNKGWKDTVTRVVVTRAERDLREIKEVYYKRNSVALEDAVGNGTSGDYKAFLLTLLGKED